MNHTTTITTLTLSLLLSLAGCGQSGIDDDLGPVPDVGDDAGVVPRTTIAIAVEEGLDLAEVYYHAPDGALLGTVAVDEDGRAAIDAMPPGGIVTVAMSRGDQHVLQSHHGIEPGDHLSLVPPTRGVTRVNAMVPEEPPQGTEYYRLDIACSETFLNRTEEEVAIHPSCAAVGEEVAAVAQAMDDFDRPIGFTIGSVRLEDGAVLDMTDQHWRTDFDIARIALDRAPAGGWIMITADGLTGRQRLGRSTIVRPIGPGGAVVADLPALPGEVLDRLGVTAGIFASDGEISLVERGVTPAGAGPTRVDLNMAEELLPLVLAAELDGTRTHAVATLDGVPRCGAGPVDLTVWTLVQDVHLEGEPRHSWLLHAPGAWLELAVPELPADRSFLWPTDASQVGAAFVELFADSHADAAELRVIGSLDRHIEANPPVIGQSRCYSTREETR